MLAKGMARVATATLRGLRAVRVRVEVDITADLPGFTLTGLPSAALREARERIGAALRHSGKAWPDGRITVHLAPADLRKDGAAMDLAIAAALLYAGGGMRRPAQQQLRRTLFLGELALDGALRPVRGALALAMEAQALGFANVVLPASQAALLRGCTSLQVGGLRHLRELEQVFVQLRPGEALERTPRLPRGFDTLASLAGQPRGLRAIAVAAAGRHALLLIGPPGCGKSLLARALWELLPDLEPDRWRERLRVASLGELEPDVRVCWRPPFRAPHHSVGAAALIGGGRPPRPGEITHAHTGVLFLDELTEFTRERLDLLREPMECGVVHLARGEESVSYPCDFQFVAAANPCPCGHHGSREMVCRCPPHTVRRHLGRLSGPLRDRIDLTLELGRPDLSHPALDDVTIARLRDDVERASRMLERRPPDLRRLRERLGASWIQRAAAMGAQLGLSGRGTLRALHVASTIAALDGDRRLREEHFLEACSYRFGGLDGGDQNAAVKPIEKKRLE